MQVCQVEGAKTVALVSQADLRAAHGGIRVVPGRPWRHCSQIKGSKPGLCACVWDHSIVVPRVDHARQPCMLQHCQGRTELGSDYLHEACSSWSLRLRHCA